MEETPATKTGMHDTERKRLQNWTDRYLLSQRHGAI
jgi:hypothetical protein